MHRLGRRKLLAGIGVLSAGCVGPAADPGSGGTVASANPSVGYPHLRASGNRVAGGTGSVPEADPVDVSLNGRPMWLAAVPTEQGSTWAVVDSTDTLSVVSVDERATIERTQSWPQSRPPVVVADDGSARVVSPTSTASNLTPPLLVTDSERAYVKRRRGDVTVEAATETRSFSADLLEDSRLCRLDRNRIVALGGPTTRYDHGALGDNFEASEIVVIRVDEPAVENRIQIPSPRVVEGVAPMVTDLGDEQAILVTESGPQEGARLVAYRPDGTVLARGEPVGTSFRWRHQLAAAPFGPDGQQEIAVVKTPHIGGTVEFYRRRGDSLEIVAEVSNASSHAYGSRNLDGGLAADADGDGRTELLVPDDNRGTLRAIERRGEDAVAEWSVPLGGSLTSNVVGVGHRDGLAVGAGHSGGAVRFWLPE